MQEKCKIILTVTSGSENKLAAFVEDCIQMRVSLVAATGENCRKVEDIIDELVVGDGSDDSRFILTSSHPGESFEAVLEFVNLFKGDEYGDDVEIINL